MYITKDYSHALVKRHVVSHTPIPSYFSRLFSSSATQTSTVHQPTTTIFPISFKRSFHMPAVRHHTGMVYTYSGCETMHLCLCLVFLYMPRTADGTAHWTQGRWCATLDPHRFLWASNPPSSRSSSSPSPLLSFFTRKEVSPTTKSRMFSQF